ncbi:PREDICTED: uncharacterized protein LOC104709635 [Camelina sativa]|uniref:Uncharacterized protein LOC104709635 n=1 Tax=Camelina sativa TaxID=90675 RepID=A0ABM0TD28_CAMSA|nr:PREDICTED: uncharacterized protein LOC104709635 [Camelina sativa]
MAEFQSCIDNCKLIELSGRGANHTWYNNQDSSPITRKLDRTLINEAWLSAHPQSNALFDTPGGSDHSPILVTTATDIERRKVPFKFYNLFTTHPDYPNLLDNAWSSPSVRGTSMYELCQRLKVVKVGYTELNRKNFSNIQARTAKAHEALIRKQAQILSTPS